MKVVYIHHSGTYGGSSRSLGILIERLIELGVEAHILSPPGRAIDYFKKITPYVHELSHKTFPLFMTIVGLKKNGFHFLRNVLMLKNISMVSEIVKKIEPDIIHCNEWGLIPIGRMLKKLNYPVVMHARTMPHKSYPKLNKYVLSKVKKYCDHLICISGSVDYAMSSVPQRSIIYNPLEVNSKIIRDSKKKDHVTFVSLSAIQKTKGVFDIAEAAKRLKENPKIKIQVAGRINIHDPKSLSIKQKILKALGLINFEDSNRMIDFIKTNELSNIELLDHVENIHSVIAKADVMLAPMHLNAPPRSVYEAGIYGIPSILSMSDKVEDVIENGVCGLLINEEAPEELVEAMKILANNAELRIRLGENAKIRFSKNHDSKLNATKVYNIYTGILGSTNHN